MSSIFDAIEQGAKLKKEEYERLLPPLRVDLLNAQFDLLARDFSLVVVLAGPDRLGCAELFQRLIEWLDARRVDAYAFETPSEEEHERPPSWRWWRSLPRRGRIAVVLGEWSWTAIVRRTLGEIDDGELNRSVEIIRSFERALAADGTLFVKLWLHVPKKKLAKRAESREDCDRRIRWIEPDEPRILEHYEEGIEVAERVLRATDEPFARWHLIESTDPEHRDLQAMRALTESLKERLSDGDGALEAARAVIEAPRIAPELALARIDLSRTIGEEAYDRELDLLQERAFELSRKAFERGLTSVLVLEGWDAAGKGGAIRRLAHALDARHFGAVSIAAPTEEERAFHYLRRFWTRLPRRGRALVFDRSWYGRVLVERVEGFATEAQWRRAYREIVDFERELVDHGILLSKLWLHIDQAEQARRFSAREQTPYKKYKIGADDYRNRAKWPEYVIAADEMVQRTSWQGAPWHLIAANDKRWARLEVLRAFCTRLEGALTR